MSVHHVHVWCLERLEKAIGFPGIWRYWQLLSCHVGAKNRIQQYIFLQIKVITGYNVYFACIRAGLIPSTKKKKNDNKVRSIRSCSLWYISKGKQVDSTGERMVTQLPPQVLSFPSSGIQWACVHTRELLHFLWQTCFRKGTQGTGVHST